jgi:hypothetical protein
MPARRFPPPWSVEELEACFVVKNGAEVAPHFFLVCGPIALFCGQTTLGHGPCRQSQRGQACGTNAKCLSGGTRALALRNKVKS